MTHAASIPKATCAVALGLLLASACGGNSVSGDGDPKGGSASGGSSSGGSVSQAGKQQGGSASGGAHTTAGTASGGGPTAGAGGSPGGEACNAPPHGGLCDGYFERWFHEPSTGLCRLFFYGGCGGNENNYPSFEACQMACPGGAPNYDECGAPTDCMITGTECCGICDAPGISARRLMAFNKKYAGQLQQCAFAAEGAAPPGDIACEPCLPLADDTGSLKYFVPNCVQGQCVVEDIRRSAVSACSTDQACVIRNGNGCCESCGTKQSIAVSVSGGLNRIVCGNLQPPCAACAAAPSNEIAVCGVTGHCEVQPVIAP
jgi:hypothetical protein